MTKKWLVSLILAVFVSITAACGNSGDESAGESSDGSGEQQEENGDSGNNGDSESSSSEDGSSEGDSSQQSQMPEPDLEDIPDVVATVNGEEISGEEFKTSYQGQFQQAALQSQMSGQELDQDQLKQQVADSLVGTKLLTQEAENRDLKASQKEVDSTLSDLVEQNNFESKDKLMSALNEQQGMSEEEVMNQIKTQVKVNKLIENEAGDIEPTEEELQSAYEQAKAQQKQAQQAQQSSGEDGESSGSSEDSEGSGSSESEIPSFEEMKPDLKEQVKSQKKAEASQTLVENLREEAEVSINL